MGRVRLYGVAVTDINCRLLITSLIAEGTPETLGIAERISQGVTQHGSVTALTPAERDALLRSFPKRAPNALQPLHEALQKDQRARA